MIAIGINCIHPQYVSGLLESVKRENPYIDVPFVVYPNSGNKINYFFLSFNAYQYFVGEIYSVELGWHGKNDCIPVEDYVEDWIKLGAKFIGGCCRNSSDDIYKIKQKVTEVAKK